jgi:hypothetical protein
VTLRSRSGRTRAVPDGSDHGNWKTSRERHRDRFGAARSLVMSWLKPRPTKIISSIARRFFPALPGGANFCRTYGAAWLLRFRWCGRAARSRSGAGRKVSEEGRGAVFGDSFPWRLGWSARRRCGGVHVASAVGRETCPDSRHHVYRLIISPTMELLRVDGARRRQRQRLARVGCGRNLHFPAPERVADGDGSPRITPRRGAETRKHRGKGTAKGMALRAGLTYAAPPALVGCRDLACALDRGAVDLPISTCLASGVVVAHRIRERSVGLDVVPRTLCKLRKGMRHPQNLKAVACLRYEGAPPADLHTNRNSKAERSRSRSLLASSADPIRRSPRQSHR